MPLYKFTGFQPTFVNGLRDKDGYQMGWIKPGDVVESEVPLGGPFVLADDSGEVGTNSSADADVQATVPETPDPAPEVPADPSQVIVH